MSEDQPDVGGNREYDYLSIEEYDLAEDSLAQKKLWSELDPKEIAVLRSMASELGLRKDIVDHEDRLAVLLCLFYHCRNGNTFFKLYRDKNAKIAGLRAALEKAIKMIGSMDCDHCNECSADEDKCVRQPLYLALKEFGDEKKVCEHSGSEIDK